MNKKRYWLLAIALSLGVFVWGLIVFALKVQEVQQTVHYHANVAIFIEGKRLDISPDKYMEDIGACKPGNSKTPRDRVHFHQNNMDTVHVHDDGVTWGHLLSNLGFSFSPEMMRIDTGEIFQQSELDNWKFILNDKEILAPYNSQIRSEDQLLISFGTDDEDINAQFAEVSENATQYNGRYDPGTCQTNVNQNPLVKFVVELLGSGAQTQHSHES